MAHTNPIVDFVVWGQPTLQQPPTALDRVGIRRLLMYIEKRLRMLWRVGGNFQQATEEFMLDLVERKANIEDFDVLADESGCLLFIKTSAQQWLTIELTWTCEKGTLCTT